MTEGAFRKFRCFCVDCRIRWVQTCRCDPSTMACPSCKSQNIEIMEVPNSD
jgi:Zn finger protein HypA/HybF involved in hydrogenase expression